MNIKETISELENVLFGLNPKARGVYDAIQALKNVSIENDVIAETSNGTVMHISAKDYDPKMNMRSKTLYAIRELNRFVKNREIAEYLHSLEPNNSVRDFMTALSNPLFFLKTEKRIVKISVGTGNNGVYWGSAKWLQSPNQPLPEYMYKEEAKPVQIEL